VNFNFGVNGSKLRNETTSLNDGVSFIQGGGFSIGQLPPTRWEVGQPIGYFADAQLGRDLVRNYARNLPLTNRTAYSKERWNGEGTSNDVPRLTTGATDNNLFSDFFVEDGSYLRIKTIQVGYTVPNYGSKSIGLERVRIYGSVSNPFLFTRYQGYDPNISSGSPLDSGIDVGFYPQARTYIAGIKITL